MSVDLVGLNNVVAKWFDEQNTLPSSLTVTITIQGENISAETKVGGGVQKWPDMTIDQLSKSKLFHSAIWRGIHHCAAVKHGNDVAWGLIVKDVLHATSKTELGSATHRFGPVTLRTLVGHCEQMGIQLKD